MLDEDVGGDNVLLFEIEHTPYRDWQPAMQYCGPEPLFVSVSNLCWVEEERNLPIA